MFVYEINYLPIPFSENAEDSKVNIQSRKDIDTRLSPCEENTSVSY